MSEELFWKPGGTRPAKKKAGSRSKREDAHNNDDGANKKQQQSLRAQSSHPNNPPLQGSGSGNTPVRKTKLSGATMNMRFMMRMQGQQADATSEASKAVSLPTAAVDSTEDSSTIGPQHDERQCLPLNGGELVFPNILGRRSFGGFNRHAENAWQEHASSYKTATSSSKQWAVNSDTTLDEKKKRKRHLR